jgi:hypothetical protein
MMKGLDEKIKSTLDAKVYPDVATFHGHLPDLSGKTGNPAEFIVYTIGSNDTQTYQDDILTGGNDHVVVRYYHNITKLSKVRSREADILSAMLAAGFTTYTGAFDLGDIDQIGYDVTGFEFDFYHYDGTE